jgi:putative ABC transport system substrate-binding protein
MAFHQGLREQGYVEGQNVQILYRWADAHLDRLPALAADLVNQRVAVIATLGGTAAAIAAKSATKEIPVVFELGSDPVALGLVGSLSHPGGNVTGVTFLGQEITAKRLEFLHELIPTAKSIGYLANPSSQQTPVQLVEAENAARTLGVHLLIQNASTPSDIETAFAFFASRQVNAVSVDSDILFFSQRDQVVGSATRYAIPAIYHTREIADAGGLVSYGGSFAEAYRLAGSYAGRILKGERPADLPVQQSTKVEMVINMKTAKALGLTVPQTILLRADEVIE